MKEERNKTVISELFKNPPNGKYLKVVAPMVRYSKLEFRELTRKYGADLTFTPMIIANSFLRSANARKIEFTTNFDDTPMIVQFAANNSTDFLHASQMVLNYSDGVDLNCGCPQSWAKADGYGCYLLRNTEVIDDMMRTARRNLPSDFSVSLKIRLLDKSTKKTVDFCRQLESLNVSFITVHGRTAYEKANGNFPVDIKAVADIKSSLRIPVIFNGDVESLSDADNYYDQSKCDGFMSARAILANPALFDGYSKTPLSCVQDFINISGCQAEDVMSYQTFHHHLTFMMENLMDKSDKLKFNNIRNRDGVYEFMKNKFEIERQPINFPKNISCQFDDTTYKTLISDSDFWSSSYSSESSHGKYFLSKLVKIKSNSSDDYLDLMDNGANSLFN